jgi:5'-nucleotidase (lipoprotein e(P4) family)
MHSSFNRLSIRPYLLSLTLLFFFAVLCGCQTSTNRAQKEAALALTNNFASDSVLAVVWLQKAAEYKALCYQTYNIATERLRAAVKTNQTAHLAVVMDIDETILDNSPFQAGLVLRDEEYSTNSWMQWVLAAEAQSIPAATNFVAEAARLGVDVFYISNRKINELAPTIENLRRKNFAFADAAHVLLKGESKEQRRNSVSKNFEVILLLGDNLNDFIDVEKKPTDVRAERTTALKDSWGTRFIILPNPMYGDWEAALYDYSQTLSPAEKASIRRRNLRGYPP